MSLAFTTALRSDRAQKIIDRLDAGNQAAILQIYSGARPATGEAITTQVLLGTLTFSDPSGTVTDGVLSLSAFTEDTAADADGTATWCRASSRNDAVSTFVFDADISEAGGGGDFIINIASVVTGGKISVTGTPSITEGNA